MYTPNEIMFPPHIIADLVDSRGAAWRALVQRVATLDEQHEEVLAFMLMMIRLNGCMECETDSYRAMKGCLACALQTLRRYKGSDDDLLAAYDHAREEVRQYLLRTGQRTAILQG